ncbi:glycolate oxidase iron-sulfur subunit [Campylobacterota bacterium]|nr:glycolate oxidase iron-sulfur subunit [Campylobacterota bacterium]
MKTTFDYAKYADNCVKCAKCIPTCTIYQVNRDETTTPRGFIHLLTALQDGTLELDKNAKAIFESCFLCTSCVSVCPSKVPTEQLIENARAEIAKKFGIAWFKRVAFYLLKHRTLLDISAKLGFVFKSCGFAAATGGMRARFSIPMMKKGRLLPSLAAKSFLATYPEKMDFGGEKTVAIFIGCMANYAYTGVGDSLLYLLRTLKINALIPKDQLCCGAPSYFTGDLENTKWLIKYNIEYFELFIDTVEAVLIPEATCSSMIIHDWARVLEGEEEWVARSKRITAKCFIASKWLCDQTDIAARLAANGKRSVSVTYHDPCHAAKTQGVSKEPRALLGNYTIVEMSDPTSCCGFGGITIQTERFSLAQAVGKNKAAMIAETGAEMISAECSACRVQIGEALNRYGATQRFAHPLELAARALKEAADA